MTQVARSAFSCGRRSPGDRARETAGSGGETCDRHSEGLRPSPDSESVSPSESKLDSASLRYKQAAKLPEMLKPVTDGEATSTGTRLACRGVWSGRALKG